MASNRLQQQRLKEANAKFKEAEKFAGTTLFRWSPDWEGAALSYEAAGNTYKSAKAYEQARVAFLKGADAHYKTHLPFSSGKCMDLAAGMSKELGNVPEAADFLQKASHYYREGGNPESASDCLTRAAMLLQEVDINRALLLFEEAAEIYEDEDKQYLNNDSYRAFLSLLLRNEKYKEAIKLLEGQAKVFQKLNQEHNVFKAYLSIVIIYLKMNDYVAADRAYVEHLNHVGYGQSDQSRAAIGLLDAFEKNDEQKLETAKKNRNIGYLDNQVARTALSLTVGSAGVTAGTASTSTELSEQDRIDLLT